MKCPRCGSDMKHVCYRNEEDHRPGECYTCWDCEEDYPISAMEVITNQQAEIERLEGVLREIVDCSKAVKELPEYDDYREAWESACAIAAEGLQGK